MAKGIRALPASTCLVLLALVVVLLASGCRDESPAECWSKFVSNTDPEETQMDPLIDCNTEVFDVALDAVGDTSTPKRRYVILFLGHTGRMEALNALIAIARADYEQEYYRGDALESIYRIDPKRAKELATGFVRGEGYLRMVADEVLHDAQRLQGRRTRSAAWWNSLWED